MKINIKKNIVKIYGIVVLIILSNGNLFSQIPKKAAKLFEKSEYKECLMVLKNEKSTDDIENLKVKCYCNLLSNQSNGSIIERYVTAIEDCLNTNEVNPHETTLKTLKDLKLRLVEKVEDIEDHKSENKFEILLNVDRVNVLIGTDDSQLHRSIFDLALTLNHEAELMLFSEKLILSGIKDEKVVETYLNVSENKGYHDNYHSVLTKAVSLFPKKMDVRRYQLNYFIEKEMFNEALLVLEKCISFWPNSFEFKILQPQLYALTGNAESAEKAYLNLFQENKENETVLLGLGKFYLEQGIVLQENAIANNNNLSKSEKYLEMLYQLDSENRTNLSLLCQLYSFSGEFDKFQKMKTSLNQLSE